MSSLRLTGCVKWFNNKSGYGFITEIKRDGIEKEADYFVHFSSLDVQDNNYKYLVQGEYVEFDVVESNGGKHKLQAASISGVCGGPTMCVTHSENAQHTRRARDNGDTSMPKPTLTRQSVGDNHDTGESHTTKRY
jgi:cold shock CspA family protein